MKKILLFETLPGEDREFAASIIDATHEWGLPGVICPACGNTWSTVGLAYPLFSLADLPFEKDYRTPRAVPLSEFDFLKNRLSTVLPAGTLIRAGTEFGPLVGNSMGSFGDFAWLNPWTPLIKIEAYRRLQQAGIRLPMKASHKLMFRGRIPDPLVELQVEPLALLGPASNDSSFCTPCVACDYSPRRRPDRIVVERSSIPDHVDLFRAKDVTTVILASENLVKTTNELGLTGIEFRQVVTSP